MMPIIDRTRFEHEVSQSCPTLELQTLSYAMGALAAFSVPELHDYANLYHEQARNLIDLCERQESGDSLGNINFLEAYVILTLYELNQPNFARAYLTLGRAIRLVQILGLDSVKSKPGMYARWGLSKQPNHSISPAEQEERRRVFWSLFIFDSFASLRSTISPVFTGVVSIRWAFLLCLFRLTISHRSVSRFPAPASIQTSWMKRCRGWIKCLT